MDRVPRSGTMIVYEDRSVTFRHLDSVWIGVPHSGTRIEYGSGVTFRHQDRMRIGVSRSDTRIVYEEWSARTDTRGIKIMNLERC